jgi:hypothetical protein
MVASRKSRKSKAQNILDGLQKEQAEETAWRIKSKSIDSKARLVEEKKELQRQIKELEKRAEDLREYAEVADRLRASPIKVKKITRTERHHASKEATAGLILSDLHFEEQVVPEEVNGLNAYSPSIAIERCERLTIGFRWYVEMLRAKYKVRKAFIPMVGDFVTNWLHGAEDMASNFMGPFEAVLFARDRAIQIFDALLDMDFIEIFAPIVPGNHDRLPGSRKNPYRGRTRLSLALLLADSLASHYKEEKRLKFELSYSAQHFTDIYGHLVRGMHGDGFKYNKGVGGIYVAARRHIGDLNKTTNAPLTVFGHHHQFKQDRDWLSNGSLIGYTSYGDGAYPFEPAGQVAFTLDRDRGKRFPVLLQVQETDTWA